MTTITIYYATGTIEVKRNNHGKVRETTYDNYSGATIRRIWRYIFASKTVTSTTRAYTLYRIIH